MNTIVNTTKVSNYLIRIILILIVQSILCISPRTFAESVSLPLNTLKKPASDLIDQNNRPVDPNTAALLAETGQDISLFNPAPNLFWRNKKLSTSNADSIIYPNIDSGVRFESEESRPPLSYLARVQDIKDPTHFYRIGFSRFAHAIMMRSALLRKLGFQVNSPKLFPRLKIQFSDADEMKQFISAVEDATVTDAKDRNWLLSQDETSAIAVFSSVIVEEQNSEKFDMYWGFAPDANDPEIKSYLEVVSQNRAYRSLIVPYTLVDLPESINRFSTKVGSIYSGSLILTFPTANSFYASTIEDVRWINRRLSQLNENDFHEIVKAGQFPRPEFEELVYAKLIYRVNNLLNLTQIYRPITNEIPNPSLQINNELVKNGKVIIEKLPGIPFRYSHGDRPSPFEFSDLGRYFNILSKSSILNELLARANEQLNILKVSDFALEHQKNLQKQLIDFATHNPGQPWQRPIQVWGGFTGGFGVNASRNLGTGTYFGSTATLQLIDTVSVSTNLGVFSALDGIQKFTPIASGNLAYIRSYSHIRPLDSMKGVKNESWANLLIPRFMNNISAVLESKDDIITNIDDQKVSQNPLDKFLTDLKVGEVFTITDTIAGSASVHLITSFDMLMGLTPFDFTNSIAFGVDGSLVTLRQTAIHRTADGIQVFIRSQNGKSFGAQFDSDFFINILKLRIQVDKTNIMTHAFVIDYDPQINSNQDPNKIPSTEQIELKEDLKLSLRALFKSNDSDLLFSKFRDRKFYLEHDLVTKTLTEKFLIWKGNQFTESHLLKMQFPTPKDHPELNSEDQEVTLFSRTHGELTGRDILGGILDSFTGVLSFFGFKGTVAQISDPNPANIPFGLASWRTVRSESDLSVNVQQLPSMGRMQHIWGGWSLKKERFLKLIDRLQSEFGSAGLANINLIDKGHFNTVKKIDFYRITANLSILPDGYKKIQDLILQPQSSIQKTSGGFFSKLFGGKDKDYREGDQLMVNQIIESYGGKDAFMKYCKANQPPSYSDPAFHKGMNPQQGSGVNMLYRGTKYPCITPWIRNLLTMAREFPSNDRQAQTTWMNKILLEMDKNLTWPQIMKLMGTNNYLFMVQVNGFREGDEDGDLEYFSNSQGDPEKDIEYANGLFNYYARITRILPYEIDRTQAGFR